MASPLLHDLMALCLCIKLWCLHLLQERSTSQDLSGGGGGRLHNLSGGGHTNSNGPTASNDTANSGGQSGHNHFLT